MKIDVNFICVYLLVNTRVQVYGDPGCQEKDPPWTYLFDPYDLQKYCFRRDPTPEPRTYSEASASCMSFDSKLATPHGVWQSLMFPLDGIDRWINVKYDHTLKMYVHNGGVPMDTRWLRSSPWDTVGGHPSHGQGRLDCTVIKNKKWESVPCTNSYQFLCEFKICPPGWVYNPFVDRCNAFLGYTETFEWATKRCSQEEAIIETPRSREADLFLTNLIPHSNPSKLWIGMMNVEEIWRWNDGAKVTWTAWDGITHNYFYPPSYKCMLSDGTAGNQEPIWHRAGCNTDKAKYICGKLRCRYPYYSYVYPGETKAYHTCYRIMDERLNARQAGQFCSEDGSESNPSRLASPNNHHEHHILNQVGKIRCSRFWTGYVWNRAFWAWQSNDNTFDDNSHAMFNTGRKGQKLNPRELGQSVDRGQICTIREYTHTYLTPKYCDNKYQVVCEREQPYILTTCPELIPIADRVHIYSSSYYPKVPQSQRMNCYYYNSYAATMNYAEADRYCAGLGGYIMMPKSRRQLTEVVRNISNTQPPWVWIGADSIGHCFNRNDKCTPSSNNFKYLDGSDLALNHWIAENPDNHKERENCIALSLFTHGIQDDDCTKKRKAVCQVDHSNLRAQRNWDFLTACLPNYLSVQNWYAAPGDKCYHVIGHKHTGQQNHIDQCRKLSTKERVSPAKPNGKDQTRSLVLSRSMDINSLSPANRRYVELSRVRPNRTLIYPWELSYIGVIPTTTISAHPNGNTYSWLPNNGSYVPPKLLNFIPGTNHNNNNVRDECVMMRGDGKWEKVLCSFKSHLSCEKPSLASLTTWRSAWRAAEVRAAEVTASGSDVPRLGSMWVSMVITSSLLLWSKSM